MKGLGFPRFSWGDIHKLYLSSHNEILGARETSLGMNLNQCLPVMACPFPHPVVGLYSYRFIKYRVVFMHMFVIFVAELVDLCLQQLIVLHTRKLIFFIYLFIYLCFVVLFWLVPNEKWY